MSKIISMIERIRYNIHGLFLAVKFLCAKNTFLFLPFRYINISLRARARVCMCAYLQKTSVTKKTPTTQDKDVPHNMGKSDLIRASDFNFLMVLGKGSFGKVYIHG